MCAVFTGASYVHQGLEYIGRSQYIYAAPLSPEMEALAFLSSCMRLVIIFDCSIIGYIVRIWFSTG